MAEITSPQNPLIRHIRSLRHRKYRRREGCFWAEGIRVVLEGLARDWQMEALVWAPDLLQSDRARQAVAHASVKRVAVSQRVFRGLSSRENPQGLGALVHIPERRLTDLEGGTKTFLVVLEAPQDPGNLGTTVRTVDCAGGNGVVLLGRAADPYDPKSVRASMGSLFSIPVVTGVSIPDFVAWSREEGLRLIGTSAGAKRCYRDASFRPPLALLFGNEQKGLSEALRGMTDEVVRIPVLGAASSLNLSSAVAVMAYQVQASEEESRETGGGESSEDL